ncbi:RND family transporter, partial [Tamlana crocina]|nr:RND family transporter [Tamlana crocina]
KHLKHLNKRWINGFVNWMERMVRHHRISIFIISVVLLAASIIGIYQIKISGSLLEDMPQNAGFFKDIEFFEEEFDGVMPLEILIDTKREQGVMKLPTLRKMEELQNLIAEEQQLSPPISIVNLVKYSKQAYYNGNPKYYQLPTSQERNFILPYAQGLETSGNNLLTSFVDSTGQYARMTTFMKDIGTREMEEIEEDLWPKINE